MGGTSTRAHVLRRSGRPCQQRGFGVFLLLLVVGGLTASAAMYSFYRIDSVAIANVRNTADVLASTKAALIGYAVRRGRTTCSDPGDVAACNAELAERPGELPCPDTNDDGIAETTCIVGAVGRVPWKTLGIPDPKDSAGETLWYALSGNFRTRAAWSPLASTDITSDTRGTITVRAADNSVLTTEAVAVIIAPGAPQGSQNRGATGTVLCTVVNLTLSRNNCVTNYLESATFDSVTRAVTAMMIPGTSTSGVNDTVTYISTPDLIVPVEQRVAGEVKKLLEGYRANSGCQCYPWADTWPYSADGRADLGQNRGRFPTVAYPHAWGTGTIPALPAWLEANDWHNLIWYSVAKTNSAGGGQLCNTCSTLDQLAIIGQPSVSVVFFTPGTPADGLPRLPPGGSAARRDDLSLYLQDAENNNGASVSCPDTDEVGDSPSATMLPGATTCDTYVVPSSIARDRGRLYTLTSAPPHQCSKAAQVLTNMGPCRVSGNTVSAMCTAAVNELSASGCSSACIAAGQAMLAAPCRIHPELGQCQVHINALNTCSPA